MSTAEAEKKWEEAKKAVDKSKYSDDNSYYAVVTTVFKKMMGESLVPGAILNFDEFITELYGFSRSEADANRHITSAAPKKTPLTTGDKSETRKKDIQNAAWKHVVAGNHKKAFDAAYEVAKSHAKEDRYGEAAAHEIATRKAKYAVKTAFETHGKRR
jgi:hypothetical protein